MSDEKLGFTIIRSCDEIAENKRFCLHNHPNRYEILLFQKGDAEFWVEGSKYPLIPEDIIVVSNYEMHRVHHNSASEYKRTVINIDLNFFTKHGCEEYKNIFVGRTLGESNCVSSELSIKYGLGDIMQKIEGYLNDAEDNGVVASAALIELLYLLNRAVGKATKQIKNNEQIKNIILYINNRLTENLNLDKIANDFFISKGHLCRIFKEYTGYTINRYITYKRLMHVRELVANGASWTDAGIEVGFSSYSNFYRSYRRTYGHAPRR